MPLVVDQPGSYVLQIKGYYGTIGYISNIKTLNINTILGIGDFVVKQFIIYPNPAKNTLYFEVPNEVISTFNTITIFSLNGSLIESTRFNRFINESKISIADLQEGIYIIKLESEQGSFLSKFIKQ